MKTLYFGGPILPMDREGYAEALLTENGRVLACGPLAQVKPLAGGAEPADLEGRALLPAFVDGHSHLTALARTVGLCPLAGCASLEELGQRLRDFQQERAIPPGQWVIGFGYDQERFPEKRHPLAGDLDRFLPGHPVMVSHASGHMGAVNTLGLQALGITAATPDPEGGRIGREEGSRAPSGYLEEAAFTALGSRIPQDPDRALEDVARAQEVYLAQGVATIHDGLTRDPDWELLQAAARRGLLRADVVCYADLRESAGLLQGHPERRAYRNRLRIAGYKVILDGSPQGRTAWMTRPYADDPGYRGYPACQDRQVEDFFRQAEGEGVQLAAHCNGDAAAAQMLRCLGSVRPGGSPLRHLMIHAQFLRPDQLPEVKRLGVVPSFFPGHIYHWGDLHREIYGEERASQISPAKSALDLGVPFDFHQDTPVLPPNMLETLWCAVNRTTREGRVLGENQRITAFQALRAVTAQAAWAISEEGEKGTLSPGKRADLVILDRDPLACPPEELKDLRVTETVKDGETVYRR